PGPAAPRPASEASGAVRALDPAAEPTYALTASNPATATPDPDHRWTWWLGSVLLLGAAALTLISSRSKGTP
ncbi:hypothetical protein, partial [Nocardioides sp. AX2bis]|uniref:hypothetical protein n=1 Tax=Nocardioides sp. AX2bis TaxID=2653157 RepID=UPI0019161321